jgi:peptide deformylase
MATREIITIGHPTLRRKARKVTKFGPELKQLIDDMTETMRVAPGVGLAAPQVNIAERVIVVELPADEEEDIPAEYYAFVNPEIVKTSREVEDGQEGCLSIPGYVGEVPRHTMVVVRGQDARGKPQRVRAKDYLARVFQHEIDHLDGVLFIDRVEDPSKIHKITPEEAAEPEPEVAEALVLMSEEEAQELAQA